MIHTRTGWIVADVEITDERRMFDLLIERFSPRLRGSEAEALRCCENPGGDIVFAPRKIVITIETIPAITDTPPKDRKCQSLPASPSPR